MDREDTYLKVTINRLVVCYEFLREKEREKEITTGEDVGKQCILCVCVLYRLRSLDHEYGHCSGHIRDSAVKHNKYARKNIHTNKQRSAHIDKYIIYT